MCMEVDLEKLQGNANVLDLEMSLITSRQLITEPVLILATFSRSAISLNFVKTVQPGGRFCPPLLTIHLYKRLNFCSVIFIITMISRKWCYT